MSFALLRLFSASPAIMPGMLAIEPDKEVAGYLNMHLAGDRGKVRAEALRRSKPHPRHRDRGWLGITRQRQQNVLESHRTLLFETQSSVPRASAFDPPQEAGLAAGSRIAAAGAAPVSAFPGDQRDDSCAERQGEIVGVQGSEGEELACKRPKQGEGQDSGNGGEHRRQGPVWPPQRREQRRAERAVDQDKADDRPRPAKRMSAPALPAPACPD